MHNLEIKAPLADRATLEHRLAELGAARTWVRRMRDTFFAVPTGWLKLRETPEASELISYRRTEDAAGVRLSDYDVAPLEDPALWHRLLGRVLSAELTVAKERTLWLLRHTRIHVDRVDGLGDFVELETVARSLSLDEARTESREIIEALALDRSTFIDRPYRDLLLGT